MNTGKNIVVLHGEVPAEAGPDEQDVLTEVREVSTALGALGYETTALGLSLDLEAAAGELRRLSPLLVFNLVESIEGRDRLLHLATSLLDCLGIPYTGCGSDGMYLASNKLLAKSLLARAGMPTPPWTRAEEALAREPDFAPPYIVKSIWDNASRGLERIFETQEQLREHLELRAAAGGPAELFVEHYVEGREFNLSLLHNGARIEVLPPAEMLFVDYPPEMPRIVGYAAKWDPSSFEYSHTVRRFDFGGEDRRLLHSLSELALDSCHQLEIGGYARVDFRVDDRDNPWILEVNPNPCLSADAGLAAAAARAGYPYRELVQRILQPVLENIASKNAAGTASPVPAGGVGRRS
jgi:D-alanine-D-alanine ligase